MKLLSENSDNLNIKIITSIQDCENISEQWNNLFLKACSPPFLSFEWIISVWKYLSSSDSRLCVATIWDNKELVGLVPLEIVK